MRRRIVRLDEGDRRIDNGAVDEEPADQQRRHRQEPRPSRGAPVKCDRSSNHRDTHDETGHQPIDSATDPDLGHHRRGNQHRCQPAQRDKADYPGFEPYPGTKPFTA